MQALSDGILAGPELLREGFIHDGHSLRFLRVAVGKIATGQQGNFHGRKISGADAFIEGRGHVLRLRFGPAVRVDTGGTCFQPQRQASDQTCGLYTGQCSNALCQLLVENLSLVLVVALKAQVHGEGHCMAGIKAWAEALGMAQTSYG